MAGNKNLQTEDNEGVRGVYKKAVFTQKFQYTSGK